MNKKGISLVVLIIIIVLMIVLSAIIMANISKDDLVGGASEATVKNNFRTFEEELEYFCSKKFVLTDGKIKKATLNADINSINFNTKENEKIY